MHPQRSKLGIVSTIKNIKWPYFPSKILITVIIVQTLENHVATVFYEYDW